MKDITFVVCTKNASKTIFECLYSLRKYPVILVDKDSTDHTTEKALHFENVRVINQTGSGLADARNSGLEYVKTKYICMWGADNVLTNDELDSFIDQMETLEWVGAGFRTIPKSGLNYLSKCMNHWWLHKIQPGKRDVVGTPVIYKTEILKNYKYNTNCTHSDDTDLGRRLSDDAHKQGYLNYFVEDATENNISNIYERWSRYGRSDKEYHNKYCKTLKQKIKSFIHPICSEWMGFDLYYMPFYLLIIIIRYWGRIK